MFSILHISDLHRSPDDPALNDDLIASLVFDRDRYVHEEHPPIRPPDAIVVSGDLIQGVPLAVPDYDEQIRQQYDVAFRFLVGLTERFLAGDRSRVILVPGNHDVNWNLARSAMEPVLADAEPKSLPAELSRPGTPFRWCWKPRTLFRVMNPALYETRMSAFWDFFERFYRGVSLPYSVGRQDGYNLFELENGRMAVAAFDSCYGNDCFSPAGNVADGAISRSALELRDNGRGYELRIAIWHHSVQGPPHATDYLNVDALYTMISCGYRVGLHGHQHKAEALPYSLRLPGQHTMAVISAGSLCAGARELPRGINRQYNVIEIRDDYLSARVHVRVMLAGSAFGPALSPALGGSSFVDLTWERPTDPYGGPLDERELRLNSLILEAEAAFHGLDFLRVEALLAPYGDELGFHGRRLMIEAARRDSRWLDLARHTDPPRTIEELIFHVEALRKLGRSAAARIALRGYASRLGLPTPQQEEILSRLDIEDTLRS